MLSFTKGASSISIFLDGVFSSIDNTQPNYDPLLEQLKLPPAERDLDAIRGLVTIKKMIERLTLGAVTITDTAVLFEGTQIGNYMAERMLEIMHEGIDITPYAAFMNNVMANPAVYVRDELYQWMEKGRLPITPDGHLLAFKKINGDYTDCHTGRFDNSPGNILEMDRRLCDTNRHNHCSSGFHFASTGYLQSFGGQRVVVVKINPADVTSIPSDYNFTKGRTCRYEVVAELTRESAAFNECWKKGVVAIENPAEFPADVIAQFALPGPVANEPIAADSDPADDLVEEACAALDAEVSDALPQQMYPDDGGLKEQVRDLEDTPSGTQVLVEAFQPKVHREADRLIVTPPAGAAALSPVDRLDIANRAVAFVEPAAERDVLEPVVMVFRTSDDREFTVAEIKAALVGASIRAAARFLQIGDSTLRGWMRKAGITA